MFDNKTLIIAEAGVNHNGDLKVAKKLIKAAASSGADIVKFQTFKAANLLLKNAPKANYQKKTTGISENQYNLIKKLELSFDDHYELIKYCKKQKIEFLSSPMDVESIKFLKKIKLKRIKIPSGEIDNYIYLKEISKFRGEIILSTGMSKIKEIESALRVLYAGGVDKRKITILHCNTEYPTPLNDVNLKAMLEIEKIFRVKVGYSDHTIGTEVAIIAKLLGARVIEKHITLDKKLKGPDHKASLEPNDFKKMVNQIRNVNIILGKKNKDVTRSEKKNIKVARKSLVAKVKINKGDIFTINNLTAKRPGIGLSPMKIIDLLGKKSKNNYFDDDMINKKEIN